MIGIFSILNIFMIILIGDEKKKKKMKKNKFFHNIFYQIKGSFLNIFFHNIFFTKEKDIFFNLYLFLIMIIMGK